MPDYKYIHMYPTYFFFERKMLFVSYWCLFVSYWCLTVLILVSPFHWINAYGKSINYVPLKLQ